MTRRILITLTGILVVAGAVTPTALADASGPPPLQAAHFDGRSPDTRDFATLAHEPVVTITKTPGFEWGDFAIGIAAALGLTLVLGLSIRLLTARHGRKQQGPVATA